MTMQGQPRRWCRVVVVSPAGARLAEYPLCGVGPPDLSWVDAVARLLLLLRRQGAQVVIEDVSQEMAELLWLAALPVEVEGQAESGKEPLGVQEVQEEAEGGDLAP
jgi:hypothetical protein